jgi:hypothetical protein
MITGTVARFRYSSVEAIKTVMNQHRNMLYIVLQDE